MISGISKYSQIEYGQVPIWTTLYSETVTDVLFEFMYPSGCWNPATLICNTGLAGNASGVEHKITWLASLDVDDSVESTMLRIVSPSGITLHPSGLLEPFMIYRDRSVFIPYSMVNNGTTPASGISSVDYVMACPSLLPIDSVRMLATQYPQAERELVVRSFVDCSGVNVTLNGYGVSLSDVATTGYATGTINANKPVVWSRFTNESLALYSSAIAFYFRSANDIDDLDLLTWKASIGTAIPSCSGQYLEWKCVLSPSYNTTQVSEITTVSSDMLSHSGLGSFSASNLLNVENTDGFSTSSAGIGTWMKVDFGSGNDRPIVEWMYFVTDPVGVSWDIQYSDDNTTWNTVGVMEITITNGVNRIQWAHVGKHRYWRSLKTTAAQTGGNHYFLKLREFAPIFNPILEKLNVFYKENIVDVDFGSMTPAKSTYVCRTYADWKNLVDKGSESGFVYSSGVVLSDYVGYTIPTSTSDLISDVIALDAAFSGGKIFYTSFPSASGTVVLANSICGETNGFASQYILYSEGIQYTLNYTVDKSGYDGVTANLEGWVLDAEAGFQTGEISVFFKTAGGDNKWYLHIAQTDSTALLTHFVNGFDNRDGLHFYDNSIDTHYVLLPVSESSGGGGGSGGGVTLNSSMGGATTNFCTQYKVTGQNNVEYTLTYSTNMAGWMYEPTGSEGWVVNTSTGYQGNQEVSIWYAYGAWNIFDGYYWAWGYFDHLENGTDGSAGMDFFDGMTNHHYLLTPVGGGGGESVPASSIVTFKFRGADTLENLQSATWYPLASGSNILPTELNGALYIQWQYDFSEGSDRVKEVYIDLYGNKYLYPVGNPWSNTTATGAVEASGLPQMQIIDVSGVFYPSGVVTDVIDASGDVSWSYLNIETLEPASTSVAKAYRLATEAEGSEALAGKSWSPLQASSIYGVTARYLAWRAWLMTSDTSVTPKLLSVSAAYASGDLSSYSYTEPWTSGKSGQMYVQFDASTRENDSCIASSVVSSGYVVVDNDYSFWSVWPEFTWSNIACSGHPDSGTCYEFQLTSASGVDDWDDEEVENVLLGDYYTKSTNIYASGLSYINQDGPCDGSIVYRIGTAGQSRIWTHFDATDNFGKNESRFLIYYSIRTSDNGSTWTQAKRIAHNQPLLVKAVFVEITVYMVKLYKYDGPILYSIALTSHSGEYSYVITEFPSGSTTFDTIDHLDSALTESIDYFYRVRAFNTVEYSNWSYVNRLVITDAGGNPADPSGLLTNELVNPNRLIMLTPNLTWMFSDTTDAQSHARIVVGPSGQETVLWDSGKVPTASGLAYGETQDKTRTGEYDLQRGLTYWWKVRVWDDSVDNMASNFSSHAYFRLNQLPTTPVLYAVNREPSIENPAYTVEFVSASGTSTDETGSYSIEVILHIPSSGTIYQDINVVIQDMRTGTASASGIVASGDYAEWTDDQKTITFGYGAQDGDTDSVSIDLVGDTLSEGTETIDLAIVAPSGKIGTNGTYKFYITDDDAPLIETVTLNNAMNSKTTVFLEQYKVTINSIEYTLTYTPDKAGWPYGQSGNTLEGWVVNPATGRQNGEPAIMYEPNWGIGWGLWSDYIGDFYYWNHFENSTDGETGIGWFSGMMNETVHSIPV